MSVQKHLDVIQSEIAQALTTVAEMEPSDEQLVEALTLRITIAGYLGVLISDMPPRTLETIISFMVDRKAEAEALGMTKALMARLMSQTGGVQ